MTKELDNKRPKITTMIKFRKQIKDKHNIIQLPNGTYRTIYYKRYKVQMLFWGIWLTIKAFDGAKKLLKSCRARGFEELVAALDKDLEKLPKQKKLLETYLEKL